MAAGHRNIHLIGTGLSPEDNIAASAAADLRLRGILEVLDDAGVTPASGYAYRSWNPQHGWEAVHELIELGTPPEALICFNDRLAFGAYQALQEAGRHIPDDCSIISFDDSTLAGWLRPGLTTFAIPHRALGAEGVGMLIDAVEDPTDRPLRPVVHRLHMPLRERGSVAPSTAP